MRIILWTVLSSLALSACSSDLAFWSDDHVEQDALTASGWRPTSLSTGDVAVKTSVRRPAMPAAPARPRPAFPAPPSTDIPAGPPASKGPGFTGCTEREPDEQDCFVDGQWVDALARFEPQTGRHWFLDPNSGNTYYADNGEFRTGDAFQEALRKGLLAY
ncbi:MAG: hypothetical protein AAFX52_11865 [Pseudomonadota bacterium]